MKLIKKIGMTIWFNRNLFFVFSFVLFVLVFFSAFLFTYDSVWNYSFSYAMANGQIPFLDFNMVVPGFHAFLMSIGLRIFSDNCVVFLIEQALLVTIMFFLVQKMYGRNAWLFLMFMCFPTFVAFNQTYNFGLLFLMIILLFLEKNKKSDYLIGVLLGLLILTKHTVGVFLLIPSIIVYFRDIKKLGRRFLGLLIPCFIYVVYLLVSGSFMAYFDLCILGLFDFADKNTDVVPIYLFLSIALLIINIWYVIKNHKDILGYYVLFFYSVMFPIFSHYHFYVYLVAVSLLLISKVILNGIYIRNLSISICMVLVILNYIVIYQPNMQFMNVNNFNFVFTEEKSIDNFNEANDLYNRYKSYGDTTFLSSTTAWLNISNEEDIDYFTVLLTGNYGYNGTNKMIDRVKDSPQKYYIINFDEYTSSKKNGEQFDVVVLDYIMSNSELIEECGRYKVYYYE